MLPGVTTGPFHGVRIVDLTSVVLGPYATMLLADLGADVVKVEAPAGDLMRYVGTERVPAMGSLFLTMNRNKRSVALDLKQPAALDVLHDLVAGADVVLHNIRRPAARRLGLDHASLSAVNPSIVFGVAAGYDPRGPYGDRPAYDDVIQAQSGLLALQELHLGAARFVPTLIVDKTVGVNLAFAVAAALFARERDPERRGQEVVVPMFEVMTSYLLLEHLLDATFVPPLAPPGYTRILSPDRRTHRTANGSMCILPYTDPQAERLAALVGRTDWLADPRFCDRVARTEHHAAWMAELDAVFATRTSEEWLPLLDGAGIPAAKVQTLDEVLADPHLASFGFFEEVEHPALGTLRQPGVPYTFSRTPGGLRRTAPRLGEHSVEVLRETGYDDARIDALVASGTVLTPGGRDGSPG